MSKKKIVLLSACMCLVLVILSRMAPKAQSPAKVRQSETETLTETEAFQDTARSFEEAGISDGIYEFQGKLEGGSGRAHFDGNLILEVKDGKGLLTFTMSSDHYDYVIADGIKYEPLPGDGNSAFTVPVGGVNFDFRFTGDTTAMSVPHEIDYSVRIDAADLEPVKQTAGQVSGQTEGE